MTLTGLRELQTRFSSFVDQEILASLARHEGVTQLWRMMEYHLGYRDATFAPLTTRAGKRFRPALCLLACDAVGGVWRDALPAAAAIELLHNFSLIHDDIEDGDPLRHHRPTVWRLWGEPQAINVGDSMFALANRLMLDATRDPHRALALSRAFQETALTLTEGQYLDMSYESRMDVTPSEYLDMIGRKTSALISYSLWCGSIVGGASPRDSEKLHDFGHHLGLAFQIRDDYQGIWGLPADTGKEAAQDLRKRKKTLPVLLASERGTDTQRESLARYFARMDDDLEAPLSVLSQTGVAADVGRAVHAHLEDALGALSHANIAAAQRELLIRVARELTGQRFESSTGMVANV